jgi:hypothetical protein
VDTNIAYLRKVAYGQESCPGGKVCDINMDGEVNKDDVQTLSWIENNTLTVCDI